MLKGEQLVKTMAEQRLIQPIEKGLLERHNLKLDLKNAVPPLPVEPDSISQQQHGTWWKCILDGNARNVNVYECTQPLSWLMCSEICLLKCSKRCCMNWTLYDRTDCISSKNTKCTDLHQICLYTQTLHSLGEDIKLMTSWPIHFIICESINSGSKVPMHLNSLGAMVDNCNILILNPNQFPITLILQEKSTGSSSPVQYPKKRGRKIRNKVSGKCQLSFVMRTGSVMCIANSTVKYWDVYSICEESPNYLLCVMGRYNMRNWLISKMLSGKMMQTFAPAKDTLDACVPSPLHL